MVILVIAVSSDFNPFKWMNIIVLISLLIFFFFNFWNISFHLHVSLDLILTSIFTDSCPNYSLSNVQIKKPSQNKLLTKGNFGFSISILIYKILKSICFIRSCPNRRWKKKTYRRFTKLILLFKKKYINWCK